MATTDTLTIAEIATRIAGANSATRARFVRKGETVIVRGVVAIRVIGVYPHANKTRVLIDGRDHTGLLVSEIFDADQWITVKAVR